MSPFLFVLPSKLSRGGIAADGNNVISAPYITAQRLKARGITTVFVLGSPKMIPHFAAEGITAHLADPDLPIEELKNAAIQGVQAVVCGNTQLINYTTLAQTLQYLLDPEVAFIATNRDSIYPAAGGLLLPGANTVVSALEGCSGRTPEVMGKPEPFIFDVLAAQHGLTPDDCLMVGDRLQTDILLAVRAGAASCLVLSGVTGADEWETLAEKESAPPTAVVESIADLIGWDRN